MNGNEIITASGNLKPVAIIKSLIIVFIYRFYKSSYESVLIYNFLLCVALNMSS